MTEPGCRQTEAAPCCPRFRRVALERLYPVTGYCVLTHRTGRLMIPSIEEYRAYCTSSRFRRCPWWAHPERAEERG
jgi:hypothetical protein